MGRAGANGLQRAAGEYELHGVGWTPEVRAGLERLIRRGAGRGLPVVFDFDNTVVCGDIGEATLAMLAREGVLDAGLGSESISPTLRGPGGQLVKAVACADATEYYEQFLAPTDHGADDPTPLASGYVWAVEVMQGLRLSQVVRASREAFTMARPGERRMIEVTPGKTAYPAPFFYPEIVELIAVLIRARYDVWIVSASNVWSVRWMVLNGLNPLLRGYGLEGGLEPDHVVGVSTLLCDRRQRLFKDSVLAREDESYAALEPARTRQLRLTGKLHFPVSTYSGKVACIWDVIGRRPYLCAGDSPGDHAMLSFSENRLWIARLEKPGYLESTLGLVKRSEAGGWFFQPTLTQGAPGFLNDVSQAAQRLGKAPAAVEASQRLLSRGRRR